MAKQNEKAAITTGSSGDTKEVGAPVETKQPEKAAITTESYCDDDKHQREFGTLSTAGFPAYFMEGKLFHNATCSRCQKMFAPNKKDPEKIRPNHDNPMFFCRSCPFKLCKQCHDQVLTHHCGRFNMSK